MNQAVPHCLADIRDQRVAGRVSAIAAVHGMRRDSLLLELDLTLKIAQRNVILKDLTPTFLTPTFRPSLFDAFALAYKPDTA